MSIPLLIKRLLPVLALLVVFVAGCGDPAGSLEEVDRLLRAGQPDAALALCRKIKAEGRTKNRELADARLPKCLAACYRARREKHAYAECEEIQKELAAAYAKTDPASSVADNWRSDRNNWFTDAVKTNDFKLAERLLADIQAEPKALTMARHPYEEYLGKRWRQAVQEDDWAGAEKLLTEACNDPVRGEWNGVQHERRSYLAERWSKLWGDGQREEAEKLYGELVELLAKVNDLPDLKRFQPRYAELLKQSVEKKDTAACERLLKEILDAHNRRNRKVQGELLQGYYSAAWRQAAAAGDFAAAEKYIQELERHTDTLEYPWRCQQLAEYRLLRAQHAQANGKPDEARQLLTYLLGTPNVNLDPAAFQQALHAAWTGPEMVAQGDQSLAKNRPETALAFYEAAQNAPGKEGLDLAVLADKAEKCLLGCASQTAARGARIVDFQEMEKAETLFRKLVFQQESFRKKPDLWRKAARDLFALQVEYARLLSENRQFAKAEQELKAAVRETAVTLWEDETQAPGGNPWDGVPPKLVQQIDQPNPNATPEEKLKTLREAAGRGQFFVPQALAARKMLGTVRDQKAQQDVENARQDLNFKSSYDRALDTLRNVLRNDPGTKAQNEARKLLQSSIRRANGQRNHSQLNDLLSFYVAEAGPPAATDPFRRELRTCLEESAERFRQESPLTRIFLLSLLADVLRDDPAGETARKEAMDKGLELIKTLPTQPMPSPQRKVPSLLPGCSTLCVANLTKYHLMLFLDGPERCFVRLNPLRRGSLVVRDGQYSQAVVVTQDQVIPFRGDQTYQGETQYRAYRIVTRGGLPEPPRSSSPGRPRAEGEDEYEVTGRYALLRAPPDRPNLVVHSSTGLVFPGAAGKPAAAASPDDTAILPSDEEAAP